MSEGEKERDTSTSAGRVWLMRQRERWVRETRRQRPVHQLIVWIISLEIDRLHIMARCRQCDQRDGMGMLPPWHVEQWHSRADLMITLRLSPCSQNKVTFTWKIIKRYWNGLEDKHIILFTNSSRRTNDITAAWWVINSYCLHYPAHSLPIIATTPQTELPNWLPPHPPSLPPIINFLWSFPPSPLSPLPSLSLSHQSISEVSGHLHHELTSLRSTGFWWEIVCLGVCVSARQTVVWYTMGSHRGTHSQWLSWARSRRDAPSAGTLQQ